MWTKIFILVKSGCYSAPYIKAYYNHIQNGPHDCRGPAKAQGSKAKLTARSTLPRTNRVMDKVTQRMANS
jgi:hypothetical protein